MAKRRSPKPTPTAGASTNETADLGFEKQLWQTAVNGGWSAPYDTGVASSGTPEIARDPWNRLEIFAPVAGGSCGFRSWRQIDPNGWNGWYAPTVNGSLCVDNLAITYTGYNADVFLQTTTGAIYVTTRGAPVFPFNPPAPKYNAGTLATTTAPLMVQKNNGEVYAFTGWAGAYRWVKRNSDASWFGFAILGSSSATTPPPLASAEDALGRTIGFVVNSNGSGLEGIVSLVFLLPGLSVFVRRMHDTDRSGWWFWLALIPIIGWIVILVFLCQKPTPGRNRFG